MDCGSAGGFRKMGGQTYHWDKRVGFAFKVVELNLNASKKY